jgi:hypothetical protein
VLDVAVPFGVVTVIEPLTAPAGTVAVIVVDVKLPDAAALPPNVIVSGETNPVP